MNPSSLALSHVKRLASMCEAAAGPIWEQRLASWPGPEPIEPSASTVELVQVLDEKAKRVLANHRMLGWVGAGTLATCGIILWVGALYMELVTSLGVLAFLLAMAPLFYLQYWGRAAQFALVHDGVTMDRYAQEVWSRLKAMPRENRVSLVNEWAEDFPFAVAWIDGYWSGRSVLRQEAEDQAASF